MPAPDTLQCELPPGRLCLVTADGTDLTVSLTRHLMARGWPVVVLQPVPSAGEAILELGDGVPVVTLASTDEASVHEALASVGRHGSVGIAVVLQPQPETATWDTTALRLPFLLAKELQPGLTAAGAQGGQARVAFVTVTRMDGALGVTGAFAGDPIAAGVSGLTKSLRLEWPEVFCRAVDLDPAMAPEAAAAAVLAEICDPDRLTAEVGWGLQGRVTLIADTSEPLIGGGT